MDLDHHKLDMSPGESTDKRRRKSRRRKIICCSVIALLLALGIIILVLALTVFKAKRPVTTIKSVALRDLNLSLDIARLRVNLNVTVDANIDIDNPNRVGFQYSNSTALLKYKGEVVGEVPIPAGGIGARQNRSMNISLTIMADRLLSNSDLYSDYMSGTLPFQTVTKISGHVRILVKIHIVSYSTCDLIVDVNTRSIANQTFSFWRKPQSLLVFIGVGGLSATGVCFIIVVSFFVCWIGSAPPRHVFFCFSEIVTALVLLCSHVLC